MMAVLLFLLVIWPLTVMWYGTVLSQLWAWFVVPLGAPPLSVAHAIGLAVLVSLLTARSNTKKDDRDSEHPALVAFMGVLTGLVALIIGALAHAAM